MKTIFITGGTGYIGKRLIKLLIERGHRVIALVRKGSEQKVPAGAEVIVANPFDAKTFQQHIPSGSVFIQLLGVAHPSPKKAKQFREIDLKSVKASVDAVAVAGIAHFIYLSVAMEPVKIMRAYQEVRKEGEEYCLSNHFNCTFIRPWYVLGPGHWWPILLLPVYGLAELFPSLRKKARATGLVTLKQMLRSLINAAEDEPLRLHILEIKDIRHAVSKKSDQTKTLEQKPSYL
ncbi:MAG TPA: NAD(P)H-binding protein [Chitinophagaceae bacterium]|nr:NAD(P)H-binding protein [Chitinophagaceae bacterium]